LTLRGCEAYREQTVAEAKGATSRFLKIYDEYKKAPEVTRRRMYLETMERELAILANVGNAGAALEMGKVQTLVSALGLQVITSAIRRAEDIAPAFEVFEGPPAND
jgi:hypothetical protein